MGEVRVPRRLAAILMADVVGYGRLSQLDEEGTRAQFQADLKEVFETEVVSHHGRLIKTMGDGLLAEFPSVVDAVRCAVEAQRTKAKRNLSAPPARRLDFRIGVNLGDVIVEGEDIHGDGVNIADRLQALAEPGGVAISGSAYDQVKTKLPVGFVSLGEQTVKSIAEPVRVYRLLLDPADAGKTIAKKLIRRSWRIPAAVAAILVLAIGAAAWWQLWRAPNEATTVGNTLPSLVVLPFDNLGDDKEQGYLADGLTEDLTTELARIPGLLVISRKAAFSYKGKDAPPSQIVSELGVRYILEGSIRRVGDDMRINAQLIDAASSRHMWAERFDGAWNDVFKLQDHVRTEVSSALQLRLVTGPGQMAGGGGTSNPAAYEAYLKARELQRHDTPKDLANAASLYRKAIELDQNFGRAWANLAWVYWICWDVTEREAALGVARRDMLPKVYELLEEAKQHPSSTYYQTLASVLMQSRDPDAAISALGDAIALDPSDPSNYELMSQAMTMSGRAADAEKYLAAAMRVDPKSTDWRVYLAGIASFGMGRFEEAVASLEKIEKQAKDYWAWVSSHYFLAAAHAHLGNLDTAAAYNKAIETEIGKRGQTVSTILLAQSYFPFKHDADRERLFSGLRKAGMLEMPFGFHARGHDRLSGEEVRSLIFGHEIRGKTQAGQEYLRITAADGATQVKLGSDHGDQVVSTIDGDALCAWSRTWGGSCGVILRNPSGTPEKRNEYYFIRAFDYREFSVVD